jgi:molybdenum cofactor guanylyltransferase
MNKQPADIRGLILAGGRSTRMGTDKGSIVVDGTTQREYLFNELSFVCKGVHTSCRAEQQIPPALSPIADSYSIDSPLNGILSAFQFSPNNAWLAVAVDMPFVDRNVFQLLIKGRDLSRVATCFYNSETELPEPLLSIWEPAAYPLLLEFAKAGHRSPRDFLASSDVRIIQSPNEKIFYNMNTPANLLKGGRKPDPG